MASSGSKDPANLELEDFRQRWISDLQSRREHDRGVSSLSTASEPAPPASVSPPPPPPATSTAPSQPSARRPSLHDSGGQPGPHDHHEDVLKDQGVPAQTPVDSPATHATPAQKLVSALDHYEAASEKEAQGSMGESLSLYRKAYRLDNRVDKIYREKHHAQAAAAAKPAGGASAREAAAKPDRSPPLLSITELIASFSTLSVAPALPTIEGDTPPPCPISDLPDELLVHIMTDVAACDVADLARLALVCKRLAYLVATEQRTWKRVCLGREFGFPNMHRAFARTIEWQPAPAPAPADPSAPDELALARSLVPSPLYPSWRAMFRSRPRIRFNGCYISTVNYVRPGQHAANHAVWGAAPVLIVTYYRYLRFFPDGSLISLLTTTAPPDVVHHLSRDNLLAHLAHRAQSSSSFMHQAFRGRWRLSSAAEADPDNNNNNNNNNNNDPARPPESDLFVETEGPGGKYSYRMDFALQSGSRSPAVARNNKLAWKRFSCYNKLTDDWADFHLKNDKPYFFSRVRSYGFGFE